MQIFILLVLCEYVLGKVLYLVNAQSFRNDKQNQALGELPYPWKRSTAKASCVGVHFKMCGAREPFPSLPPAFIRGGSAQSTAKAFSISQ